MAAAAGKTSGAASTVLFLVAWVVAFMALQWLASRLLEARTIAPGQVPPGFSVVVETRAAGAPPAYEARRFSTQAELKLAPGESLRLGTPAYDQMMDQEGGGSCCIAFQVLDDGPKGQLIELNDDDLSHVMSRYRVSNGQVLPVAHRAHFTLYYVGYLLLGGLIAWLVTKPLRRRGRGHSA